MVNDEWAGLECTRESLLGRYEIVRTLGEGGNGAWGAAAVAASARASRGPRGRRQPHRCGRAEGHAAELWSHDERAGEQDPQRRDEQRMLRPRDQARSRSASSLARHGEGEEDHRRNRNAGDSRDRSPRNLTRKEGSFTKY